MRPLIVHVHVPHTGGTSIQHLLNARLRTAVYSAAAARDGQATRTAAKFIRKTAEARLDCDAVTGHFKHLTAEGWSAPYLEKQCRPLRLITTLRHPLIRAISDTSIGNFQTAYILDMVPDSSWGADRGAEAFQVLRDTFWWVGRTRALSRSWPSLCGALGLSVESPRWANRSGTESPHSRPPPAAEACREINQADMRLYELARRADLTGLGLLFAREIPKDPLR